MNLLDLQAPVKQDYQKIENQIMFRGVRLREYQVKNMMNDGMKYYWNDPERAVSDIYRALEKFHKISHLGRSAILRAYILEASRVSRLQIWCTEDKFNAMSYARSTPELISLTLRCVGIEKKKVESYLNNYYGKPYVVTFQTEEEIHGINLTIGTHIKAENIISVEEVNITKPDPYMIGFSKYNEQITEEELLKI